MIGKIATALISPVTDLISEFITDKDEAARLAFEISSLAEKQAHEINMAQVEVNKVAASHASIFVSGARPAMLWVCVTAFALNFVGFPLLEYISMLADSPLKPPELDISEMTPILLALLGLGGMRAFEKAKGVARSNMLK